MDIAELKRKSVAELQDMADGLKIPDVDLAAQPRPTTYVTWIEPLRQPLPAPDESLRRIVLKQ